MYTCTAVYTYTYVYICVQTYTHMYIYVVYTAARLERWQSFGVLFLPQSPYIRMQIRIYVYKHTLIYMCRVYDCTWRGIA